MRKIRFQFLWHNEAFSGNSSVFIQIYYGNSPFVIFKDVFYIFLLINGFSIDFHDDIVIHHAYFREFSAIYDVFSDYPAV